MDAFRIVPLQLKCVMLGRNDLETAIASHKEHILHETHARDIVNMPELEGGQKWMNNKMPLELVVRKA